MDVFLMSAAGEVFLTIMAAVLLLLVVAQAFEGDIEKLLARYGRSDEDDANVVSRYGPMTLYRDPPELIVERHKQEPQSWPITPDVTAHVEAAGSVEHYEGWVNMPTSTDHRELYLLIEGPDWHFLTPCDAERPLAPREFAASVNTLARSQRS